MPVLAKEARRRRIARLRETLRRKRAGEHMTKNVSYADAEAEAMPLSRDLAGQFMGAPGPMFSVQVASRTWRILPHRAPFFPLVFCSLTRISSLAWHLLSIVTIQRRAFCDARDELSGKGRAR